ncbi:MAG: lysylphosphatidylglycerol synthase transmembrane domain-containing protein [bacterium]|nr:lysylphosphatidylglycerol synthase transmembrane domain-containing protein [bacterium]
MGKFIKFGLSLFIGLTVFFIVLLKIGVSNATQALGLFFSLQGLSMLAITALLIWLSTVKWKLVLKYQGEKFSTKELTPFILIGLAMSYLTPFAIFGGEIFRVYFFKKKYPNLKAEKAMASVATDRILEVTAFFTFLIFGLLVFGLFGPVFASPLGVFALIFAGFFLSLLLIFYLSNWRKKSALEWLIKTFGLKKYLLGDRNGEMALETEQEVFRFFSLRNKVFWQGLGLAFLEYFGFFVRAVILVFFITGSFEVVKSLAVYSFANLASLTPLPATLGALELSQGFAFSVLGFGFNKGAVFSMVWRATDLFFCFIGLFFFAKHSAKAAQDKLLNVFSSCHSERAQ